MSVIRWTGVLGHVDTPTTDGRTLAHPRGRWNFAGRLPAPLLVQDAEHGFRKVGTVSEARLDGLAIRANGSVDLDLLRAHRQPTLAARLEHLQRVPVRLSTVSDDVTVSGPDDDQRLLMTGWRITEALIRPYDTDNVYNVWPAGSVYLVAEPAVCAGCLGTIGLMGTDGIHLTSSVSLATTGDGTSWTHDREHCRSAASRSGR